MKELKSRLESNQKTITAGDPIEAILKLENN